MRLLDQLKEVHFGTLTPHQISILNTLKYGSIFGLLGYTKIQEGIEVKQHSSSAIIECLKMYRDGILVLLQEFRNGKDRSEEELFRLGHLIGVNQYKKAIARLNDSEIEFLKGLYYLYPAKDHHDLAERLHYKDVGGVNLQIGKLSNEIIRILNFKHPLVKKGTMKIITTPGFFSAVHKIANDNSMASEKKWIMEPNLSLALEEIKLVRAKQA